MSFTEDQIDEFQEVFRLFDTKGDGMIPVIVHIVFLIEQLALIPSCFEEQKAYEVT